MILFLCFSSLGLAKNNFLLTSATECLLHRLCRLFLQELKRNSIFSIVGLDEAAQVLKSTAFLPDPKPEVTPMSTPINRKTRFNHAGTVTPIVRTPETPSMSRFHFSDPGTPTEKVSEVFKENYARDRVVWRTDTLDSSLCPGSQLVYFTLCLARPSSKEFWLVV